MTTNRLTALRRIQKVQADMEKLADMRLAAARREHDRLREDKDRLEAYVADSSAPNAILTEAALKTMKAVDRRAAETDLACKAYRAQVETLSRRGHALDAACRRATAATRRAEEARDLAAVLEAWFTATGAEPSRR